MNTQHVSPPPYPVIFLRGVRKKKKKKKVEEYNWGSPVRDNPALARGRFDIILCSDLFYDPADWEALRESLYQLWALNGTIVYLAHRTRNIQEQEFFALLERGERNGKRFRCRKLLTGSRHGNSSSSGNNVRGDWGETGGGDDGGCRERVLWRRGCFPDVALYELSTTD